ncbi:MAG: VCBS repeat-containing protein [Acidobacteria bacterium]|nr:VCBS repeat-containing protein [Acidobacteriota bacterium]
MTVLSRMRSVFFGLTMLLAANFGAAAADGDLDAFFNAGVTWRGSTVTDAAVQTDGKIIISGNFSVVNGRSMNCLARLNADGSLDASFNIGLGASLGQTIACNGAVNAVALQPDGKILVGGDFSTFGTNGSPDFRGRLARLNPDGTLDTSFIGLNVTGPSGIVDDIVVQPDGKILIASFNMTEYNGTTVGYFARLNSDGSLDTAFNNNLGAGFDNSTKKIALQPDGKILVGGAFFNVNGTASHGLARLNANGSVDTAFSTATGGGIGPGSVYGVSGIAVQTDGKIVIGGAFIQFSGASRLNLARLNATGTLDAGFGSPVSNTQTVESVVIQPNGKILVAGGQLFFDDGTTQRSNVARLNQADGSIDATFNIGAAGANGVGLPSMFLQTNGKILLGGSFTAVNDKARLGFARLETNGDLETNFTPVVGQPGTVKAIAVQPDNKILLGGDFYGANGSLRPRLTRLNPDGTTDSTFNPGADVALSDYSVSAIAVQPDGKILIGGDFPSYGGAAGHAGIARLNYDGSLDANFNAETLGVSSIAVQPDGKIVIGGFFTMVNGQSGHNRIARLNPDGTLDAGFTATGNTCNCGVLKVAVQADGKILVGGYFNEFNGTSGINNLVRLNADGSVDAAFTTAGGTGFDSIVNDIDIQPADNKILITGGFSNFNGTSRAGLARLQTTGALDGTFSVGAGFNPNISPVSLALDPNGGMVVVGGFFQYQGVTRNRIVRIGPTGAIDPNFNASLYDSAEAVAFQSNGKTIVGGGFRAYGNAYGTARIGFARLRSGRNTANFDAPFDFDGDGRTDLSIFRPSNNQWWYERSSDGAVPSFTFGQAADKIMPADFTGDGKTDIAVFRPSTSEWWVLRSEDNTHYSIPFGQAGDIPAPADYDGDGKADLAVFRPATGVWIIRRSSDGQNIFNPFGTNGDKPVPADYDGDGKADIAVFRPATGVWWISLSTAGVTVMPFGIATDRPVPGDWTGDGKADIAVWRPSTGEWFVLRSENDTFFSFPFGQNGDVPAPGDYDGDGLFDATVFRPAGATWFVNRTTAGVLIQNFGLPADQIVPNAFVP